MPMYRTFTAVAILATASSLLATAGCGKGTPTPTGPSSASSPSDTGAAPDGSTLKASAPGLVSPVNDETLTNLRPTMVISGSTGRYVNQPFSYEFELQSDSGAVVARTTQGETTWEFGQDLQAETPYRWRARALLGNAFTSWSSTGRFITGRTLIQVNASSSVEEWRIWFFQLIELRGVGPNVSQEAMRIMRPDLNAVGADFQHDSAGTLRERVFLPNPGGDPWFKAIDIGVPGRPWQWIVRF
jgi:hypothetical protein